MNDVDDRVDTLQRRGDAPDATCRPIGGGALILEAAPFAPAPPHGGDNDRPHGRGDGR